MSTMIEGTTRLRRSLRDEDGASYHGVAVYAVQSQTGATPSSLAQVILAMYTALTGDAQLMAALRAPTAGDTTSARVFHGEAPNGTLPNYIVLSDSSEAESVMSSFGVVGVDDEITVDIWGVPTTRHYNIANLYAHIARVLHGQRLVLT